MSATEILVTFYFYFVDSFYFISLVLLLKSKKDLSILKNKIILYRKISLT